MKKKKAVKKSSSKKKVSKKSLKKISKTSKFSISERAKNISFPEPSKPAIPQVIEEERKIVKKTPALKTSVVSEQIPPPVRQTPGAKIFTGINGFDVMTNGGFESQSINLVAGGSGSGKTIFALQFLLEGLRRKERVLYITFEEKKEDFYNYMKDFSWDLQKAEQSGSFFFLEYSPEKVKQMLDEGGGTIENMVLKYGITRIVFDSLTSFSLMFDDELSKRQSILGLFDILRKWDCTTLLTVQHNPVDREDRGMNPSEFEADSITLLYNVKEGSRRSRFIEVLKMRGENHSKEIHQFIIKKGIEVGPIARTRPF